MRVVVEKSQSGKTFSIALMDENDKTYLAIKNCKIAKKGDGTEVCAISDQLNNGYMIADCMGTQSIANAAYIAAACPANILPFLESYEELLAAAKGYLDNSVRDIGRQGRQAHGALLQAITNAEKLNHE